MSVKEKNMRAIQNGFPELYDRIAGLVTTLNDQEIKQIENMETLSDIGAIVIQTKEDEIVRLNSAYDPEYEANIWAKGQEGLGEKNLFLLGLGNGCFAKGLMNVKEDDSRLLIYEPSPKIFMFALEQYDISDFFQTKGVRVIVEGINDDMFSGVMEEMLTLENCESKAFFVSPQIGRLFPESRKRYVDGYLDGVGRLMSNKNTIRRFIHLMPYNQLHNLQYLEKNTVVPKLAKIWDKEVPVIIIGAGPSLREDIEVLKEIRNRVYLFAVDSALPFLLQNDIVPDAYICIEADKPMTFFEDERVKDIPLFAKVGTTHKLLDCHRARKIFGYEDGLPEKIYEINQVPVSRYRFGGNGATSLFAICKDLGVKNIILVGQDMAYSSDKVSHAGGRNEGYVEEKRFVYESNTGEEVQSRQDWHRFVIWYENAIPVCNFEHVINTAARGVKIKGTQYMTLSEAVALYGKEHGELDSVFENAECTFGGNSGFSAKNFYEKCLKELVDLANVIKKNPRDEKRKEYILYELLQQYEIADLQNNFIESQKKGIEKIREYLVQCQKEVS